MNFKTENETAKDKNIKQLLQKINFLENENKVLSQENESLKVKIKIDKNNFQKNLVQSEDDLRFKIDQLKTQINNITLENKTKILDLNKTVLVGNKPQSDKNKDSSGLVTEIELNFCDFRGISKQLEVISKKLKPKTNEWIKTETGKFSKSIKYI